MIFRIIRVTLEKFGYTIVRKRKGFSYVPDFYGKSHRKVYDIREIPIFKEAAEKVVAAKKTCLYYDRLYHLFQGLSSAIKNDVGKGTFTIAEVGVFRGGGSYFLADIAKQLSKNPIYMASVDTFEGHSNKDITSEGSDVYHLVGGFNETTFKEVKEYLSTFDFIEVIKGRIQDCEDKFSDMTFNFVHVDTDLEMPTTFSLEFFGERMAQGGVIVVDDYGFVTCPGVRKAVDSYYLKNKKARKLNLESGQCILFF